MDGQNMRMTPFSDVLANDPDAEALLNAKGGTPSLPASDQDDHPYVSAHAHTNTVAAHNTSCYSRLLYLQHVHLLQR